MTKVIQPSIAGGEISFAVGARVDLSKRAVAVEIAENIMPRFSGGASSRPGQRFVARVKDSTTAVRVIEFEFSTTQTYILELGNLYMRFHTNGAQILTGSTKTITGVTAASPAVVTSNAHGYSDGDEIYITGVVGMTQLNGRNLLIANKTTNTYELTDLDGVAVDSSTYTAYSSGGTTDEPYEIATPYVAADLFDIKYEQVADVMTIVHPTYQDRELVRVSNASWTLTEILYGPEQAAPTTLSVTANTTGAVVDRYVVTSNNLETFEESQRAIAATLGTITAITKADPAEVTLNAHGLSDGDEVYIDSVGGMTQLNERRFVVANKTTNTFELTTLTGTNVDSTGYTTYTSAGEVYRAFFEITNGAVTRDNTITWAAAVNAESYNVYRQDNGIYGFVGRTELLTFTDDNIEPDTGDTPPRFRDPFELGAGYYPSTVGYFKQRKIYASSNTYPNRFWMTQIGNFYNFAVSSPARDDDAIIATIASRRINDIEHIVPLSSLIVLTGGGEYLVTGIDDKITPSGIEVKPQSYYGSTALRPIVAGKVALFESPGGFIRDLQYDFAGDTYAGQDVTVLARHLFDDTTLVDWDYASAPYSMAWAVRDDGVLLSLTYVPDQEVYAWARHSTFGNYESVAVVREGTADIPYFVVERKINGNTVKFIERQDPHRFTELSDAMCVDAGLSLDSPITISGYTTADPVVVTAPSHGLSNGDVVDINGVKSVDLSVTRGERISTEINGEGYTIANVTTNTFELQSEAVDVDGSGFAVYSSAGEVREAVTTVSGLWHLEGQTVVAAANGYAETGLTVTNGAITLSAAASRVHVGLGYICRLKTLPIAVYTDKSQSSAVGTAKVVTRLTVQVERTMGMWTGPSEDLMREAKFGLPSAYGQALDMIQDDIDVTLKSDWKKRGGQVVIEQRSPLPLTILALIPDVTRGGN